MRAQYAAIIATFFGILPLLLLVLPEVQFSNVTCTVSPITISTRCSGFPCRVDGVELTYQNKSTSLEIGNVDWSQINRTMNCHYFSTSPTTLRPGHYTKIIINPSNNVTFAILLWIAVFISFRYDLSW